MQRPESSYAQAVGHSAAGPTLPRSRAATITAISAIAFLASWAGAATLYILFNDDALRMLVERQVSITRSYETQAAALQSEIERLRSLKLIDQERVDRAVADLARRQTIIETRYSALSALKAESPTPDKSPNVAGSVPEAEPQAAKTKPSNRPSPLSDTILFAVPSQRWAQLQSRPLPPLGRNLESSGAETATEVRLTNLSRELRRLEAAQSAALNDLEIDYDGRKRRIRKVLDELGVHPHRAVRSAANSASQRAAAGGPFLPWTKPPDDPFARQIHRIRTTSATLRTLEREIDSIPLRRPTAGEADVTSAFGLRLDPFLRQPAMHTGIDFRGEPRDPVYAAAAGRVAQAERNGGYGLMVEIDHGNGIATRYAHLSAIDVDAGTSVAAGSLIGRIGSTGRSTGPHLHYEVRLQGDAIDPQRFLRAGLRLQAAN